MVLIIINQTILALPCKVFAIKVFVMSAFEDTHLLPIILASNILVLDLVIGIYFKSQLQMIFPMKQIPWAMPSQRDILINELQIYVLSLALAFPPSFFLDHYFYLMASLLSLGCIIYISTLYNQQVTQVSIFGQSCQLTSMFIMSMSYFGNVLSVQTHLSLIYAVLMLAMYQFKMRLFEYQQGKSLANIHKFQKDQDGYTWIQIINHNFNIHKDMDKLIMLRAFLDMQNILQKHQSICDVPYCRCQSKNAYQLRKRSSKGLILANINIEQCHQLKLLLIEIGLKNIIKKQRIATQKLKKNNKLELLLTFSRYQLDNNYARQYFSLMKHHDCETCSYSECSQHNLLKSLIIQEFQNLKHKENNVFNYASFISYELDLKMMTKTIDSIINNSSAFWTMALKKQLDLKLIEQQGNKILANYVQFTALYQRIKSICGDMIQVEHLTFRLHNEILNFEVEAHQNAQKLTTLIQNHQSSKKLNNLSLDFANSLDINSKASLVMISANPHNFHKVLSVSNQFLKVTQFNEEYLINNRATIIMPAIIERYHESIVKNFLKQKNKIAKKQCVKQQWLRTSTNTVLPVNIELAVFMSHKDGICIVGLIKEKKKLHVYDIHAPSSQVFCILTDMFDRILHVSQTCQKFLNFPADLQNQEHYMSALFPNMGEEIVDESNSHGNKKITNMLGKMNNAHMHEVLGMYDKNTSSAQNIEQEIAMTLIQNFISPTECLKEYLFVMLKDNSACQSQGQNLVSMEVLQFSDYDQQKQNGATQEFSLNAQEQSVLSSAGDQFQMSSISSASSSSSTTQKLHASQVGELKSQIDFNVVPQALRYYRLKLSLIICTLIIICIVLLSINTKFKNAFVENLVAMQTEKRLGDKFACSKLSILYMYGLANSPASLNSSIITTQFLTPDTPNYASYFLAQLSESLNNMQIYMQIFSLKTTKWDQSFVKLITQNKITLKSITTNGSPLMTSATFWNALETYIGVAQTLVTYSATEFEKNYSIPFKNNADQYGRLIAQLPAKNATMENNFYFVIMNGGQTMPDQMNVVDTGFMGQMAGQGVYEVNIILGMSIFCCVLILIIATLLLPFQFKVENAQRIILELACTVEAETVSKILKEHQLYQEQLIQNEALSTGSRLKVMNQKKSKQPQQKVASYEANLGKGVYQKQVGVGQQIQGFTDTSYSQQKTNLRDKISKGLRVSKFSGVMMDAGPYKQKGGKHQKPLNKYEETKKDNKFIEYDDDEIDDDSEQSQNLDEKKVDKSSFNKGTNNGKLGVTFGDQSKGQLPYEKGNQDGQAGIQLDQQNQNHINEYDSHHYDRVLVQAQLMRKRLYTSALMYAVATLIITLYVVTYILSKGKFDTFQQGFLQYDVFFKRVPCLTESFFYIQRTSLLNDTMQLGTPNGDRLQNQLRQCQINENSYMQIKSNPSGTFKLLETQLSALDNDLCHLLESQGILNYTFCTNTADGILTLGTTQVIQQILSHLLMIQIKYQHQEQINNGSEMTDNFLKSMFYDPTTIIQTLVLYNYMLKIFEYTEDLAHVTLRDQINSDFQVVIAVFCVFILLLAFSLPFVYYFVIKWFKVKMIRIRLIFKVIPSSFLTQHKEMVAHLSIVQQ